MRLKPLCQRLQPPLLLQLAPVISCLFLLECSRSRFFVKLVKHFLYRRKRFLNCSIYRGKHFSSKSLRAVRLVKTILFSSCHATCKHMRRTRSHTHYYMQRKSRHEIAGGCSRLKPLVQLLADTPARREKFTRKSARDDVAAELCFEV
jgi:hypothetical protein